MQEEDEWRYADFPHIRKVNYNTRRTAKSEYIMSGVNGEIVSKLELVLWMSRSFTVRNR